MTPSDALALALCALAVVAVVRSWRAGAYRNLSDDDLESVDRHERTMHALGRRP